MAYWTKILEELETLVDLDLLPGESKSSEDWDWRKPEGMSHHIEKIAWARLDGVTGRNPIGALAVNFADGGLPRGRIYVGVHYRQFYTLWKETPSSGKYLYYYISERNRKSGIRKNFK